MKNVIIFFLLSASNILFGQTSTWQVELGSSILNKYGSGSIKGFNTVSFGDAMNWVNMPIGVKYMPNVEKQWMYGLSTSGGEIEGSRQSLPKETTSHWFSWRNYGGYVGYQVIQRKHMALTVGVSPELTLAKYQRYNDTVSVLERKPYFRLNPEIDMDFIQPFDADRLFMASLRLRYEMPVGIMPSRLSLGVVFKLGKEIRKPYIQQIQRKGSNQILFYAKSIALGSDLLWDFGDGTTSTEKTPTKTYNEDGEYKVTVTGSRLLTGSYGSEDNSETYTYTDTQTATTLVKIGRQTAALKHTLPSAYFDVVTIDTKDRLASFKNMSKNGDDYLWNFGDRETSTEKNPTHQFLYKGLYKVELVVKDTLTGETATYKRKIRIK